MRTAFTAFVPIAIIVILPVLFLLIRAKNKYLNVKVTHWLVMIYTGILLLSLVVVSFIKPVEIQMVKQEENDLYETIHDGEISKIGSKYLLLESGFDFEGKVLSITSPNYNSLIFLERKKEDDSRIDVKMYGIGFIMDGVNLSEKVIPPRVRLDDDQLTITRTEFQEIKLARVKNEFIINQFTREPMFKQGFDFEGPIMYLQIPHNLEIKESPEIRIHYVN